MTKQSLLRSFGIGAVAVGCVAGVRATVINFDTNALGSPLTVTGIFDETVPLRELYAPLGVHFEGPSPGQGGAILDEIGNFGINARSGRNFLAFNRHAGYPNDPENILFDANINDVSIFAGDDSASEFTMTAYDALNNVVGFSTVTNVPMQYAQIGVSAPGIRRVALRQTPKAVLPEIDAWVYDDLTFNTATIPEPGGLALLLAGAIPVAAMLRRRRS